MKLLKCTKAPDNIEVVFPIKYGVIADLKKMKMLFEQFFKKLTGPRGSKWVDSVLQFLQTLQKLKKSIL